MNDLLVLCYHAVSPRWGADLAVSPAALERQMRYLVRHGWRPATFTRATLNPAPQRTFAVTFDDAFLSVCRYAAPVLQNLNIPATVFAPTLYINDGRALAWSGTDHWLNTPQADELEPMSWDDLRELSNNGWEIGSHTRSHFRLTQLDDRALEDELSSSRQECAAEIGSECASIAYPYGDVDARVAGAAQAAGYSCGAALDSRLERLGPMRAPRVGIYPADVGWRYRLKVSRPLRVLRASPLWPA